MTRNNDRQIMHALAFSSLLLLSTAGAAAAGDEDAQAIVVTGTRVGPLDRQPSLGKTGTPLGELPADIQVIDRGLVDAQGGVSLTDAIGNASGIGRGGGDGFGFSDRYLVRGLDARIYSDGFSDGDQRNGFPHSLNGVERIEVLKGPGSALLGSGPPGGTIAIVHFPPSDQAAGGGALHYGSFATVEADAWITGPLAPGLTARVDGLVQHSDGFRGLAGRDDEIRPEIAWRSGDNLLVLSLDLRSIHSTPDPAGLIYLHGLPIRGVGLDAKYSTPFSRADQNYTRLEVVDSWTPAPFVAITNRFSTLRRTFSILRNGDSGTVSGTSFSGRQLRRQHDQLDDFDDQLEPLWHFRTGSIGHSLQTGLEIRRQALDVDRATADLPAIPNIFAPAPPETEANLVFLRDAKHFGAIDRLRATSVSLYATDQIDLSDRLKLRVGGRQDWFRTALTPQISVPGRLDPNGRPFQPGVTEHSEKSPFSWNAGLLYRVAPGVTPYIGISRSNLVNFSSEATQNGLAPVETGLQYEAGVKISALRGRLALTAAAFDTRRDHVFALVGDTPMFNDQKTRGVEADLTLQATKRWRIIANTTLQRARLTDNPSNPAATGKVPQGVPTRIAHLWTDYRLTGDDKQGLRIGAGLEGRSMMYGNILNTNWVPGYVTEQAVLTWDAGRWELSAGMRNLSDRRWFIAANGAGALVGEPRTIFASARIRFGP
jgi:iron complex outermembrane receptor protein